MSSVLGTRTLSTEIGAQRRVEARIGQLLGAAENLGPATLVHDQRLAHDDRHDFRILARGFDADARARRDATFLAFTPTGVNPKNLTERRFRGYWGQTDKTKGQRAMAVAMIYPESQQGKRNAATSSVSGDVSATRIKMARTILKWAPEISHACGIWKWTRVSKLPNTVCKTVFASGARNRPRRTRSERFKPTRVGEGSLALAIAAAVRVCNGVCTFPPLIGSPTARSFGAPQLRVSQLANNWQKAGFWRFRQTDKLAGANGESLAVGARGRI